MNYDLGSSLISNSCCDNILEDCCGCAVDCGAACGTKKPWWQNERLVRTDASAAEKPWWQNERLVRTDASAAEKPWWQNERLVRTDASAAEKPWWQNERLMLALLKSQGGRNHVFEISTLLHNFLQHPQ